MARLKDKHGPLPRMVAARIRAERERLGLSQEEAARRLGMSRSNYKQYEARANPQLGTLIGLTRVLGMRLKAIAPELFPTRTPRIPD
jgi:transcriptional regulator with XRE-family HTH domain